MHGHMPPPQQHPGLHPAHQQPPPHLPHLSNLPPHSMQREHPANRLNNARHHHPRDHQAAMGPHLQMQVPPPPHRKPLPGPPPPTAGGYYTTNGPTIHGGLPKPLPMTAAHLHPPPALTVGPPPHQQHPGGPLPPPPGPHPGVVGKLPPPYGGQHGKPSMAPHQQHQPPVSVHHSVAMAPPVQPPIPVVSAATPAGTKTRHIPSTTDQKVHHHSQQQQHHVTSQTNGTIGGGPKGSGVYSEKSKPAALASAKATKDAHPSSTPASTTMAPVTVSANAPCTPIVSIVPSPVSPPEASAPGSDTTLVVVAEGATGPTVDSLSSANSTETLANMKEKTTMCMVNELARHNKILHQYRLTGETGPAHKKRFTVTLKLGDEEYTAEGASIKKAQHEAAGKAIAETKYKHPPARTNRRTKSGVKGNTSSFTPTVELNALAMKRGEPTVYKVMASPLPVSKYANGGAFPPGGNAGRRALGPGPVDKLPPSAPGLLPYGSGGSGLPPGAGGRYGHPHGLDGGGGGVGPGGFWGRAPPGGGGGGRGGMGGFHPGHQHQPPPPPHVHAHHHRGGLEDPHHHHHHPPHVHHHHHHHSDTAAAAGYGSPAGPMNVHELYKATLRVGERTFLGEGQTPQAARHDAAARALEVLKPLTLSESAGGEGGRGKHTNADGTVGAGGGDPGVNGDAGADPNAELKSPISLVHELAVQCQLPVEFEVISEKGPPHMTVFVTQCKVGTIVTEGEGTGKKQSKKRAAEKMLDELRKLKKTIDQESAATASSSHGVTAAPWPERSQCERRNKKNAATVGGALSGPAADGSMVAGAKKKSRNLIKDKSVADVSEQENPISRLMQIQQARKEKQPVYTLIEGDRSSTGRRKQFTIEVAAAGKCAVGVGLTKKAAKWSAAEGLLSELGFAVTKTAVPSAAGGAVNKENQSAAANAEATTVGNGQRKVVFNESIVPSKASDTRALVNGNGTAQHGKGGDASARDLMNDSTASNDSTATNSSGVSSASSGGTQAASATTAVQSSAASTPSKPDVGRNKEQLMYLAQLLKFEVQFSDFPKGNHGEYLTLVVLTTEPPQMCHGSGASLQESQDEAARCALEMLSKIGLDNVKPKPVAINSSSSAAPPVAGASSDDGAIAATASK
ncbi:double-stranded RNA-binding protein Staufen homolog [Anopheles cruzii]|uniref:double-stranded RNA-binding protein Staufen homolog n=1 Tax=Anopheles cruzii TaxID=68878 RepID=UPI0022EC672A|nr:double-stranded RNA-binding protein Staufen homolog [Anopheles cruzii]